MTKKIQKEWPGDKAFYVLWNPKYHEPPKVMFQTLKQAEMAAEQMVRRNEIPFYVMKAVKKMELPPPKLRVTEYE